MSDRQKGESIGTSEKKNKSADHGPDKVKSERAVADKKRDKQREKDLGRALRSVYDETLREEVPADFSDLLGKLS